MILKKNNNLKAEEYVSPSFEVSMVSTERGFCFSDGTGTATHDGFYDPYDVDNYFN